MLHLLLQLWWFLFVFIAIVAAFTFGVFLGLFGVVRWLLTPLRRVLYGKYQDPSTTNRGAGTSDQTTESFDDA